MNNGVLSRSSTIVLWTSVVVFVAIGVTASAIRTLAVSGAADPLVARMEEKIIRIYNLDNAARAGGRDLREEVRRYDARFKTHRWPTLLHVVPGGLFLALAPLQFSPRFRNRHLRFHRMSGRILAAAAIVSGLTGLFFGVVIPYAGIGEVTSTGIFGVLFIASTVFAVAAIRRGDVRRHREWMIRAFSIGIGISTIRVIAVIVQSINPSLDVQELVGPTFWSGWTITFVAGEAWIRYTRHRAAGMDLFS